jgi:hypothetical protein
MKAKFFSTKFFFGVLVVFAVICLFVVFGVVRANERLMSRVITVETNNVLAMHKVEDGGNIIASVHYVVDHNNVVLGSDSDVHEQVNQVDMDIHMAAVPNIVKHRADLDLHRNMLDARSV